MTLEEYYQELVRREGKPNVRLVSPWDLEEAIRIDRSLCRAFAASRIHDRTMIVPPKVSRPSLGNKVASHVAAELGEKPKPFKICSCGGPGYPDRRLVRTADQRAHALEIKASWSFKPNCDSEQRIILTSSSRKLQREFVPPINHLLLSVFCTWRRNKVCIDGYRVDFLQPWTKVNVRFEASVSNLLLAEAEHPSFYRIFNN